MHTVLCRHYGRLCTYRDGDKVSFDVIPEFILALANALSYCPHCKKAPLENTIPPEPPNAFVDVVLVYKALTGPKQQWEKCRTGKYMRGL